MITSVQLGTVTLSTNYLNKPIPPRVSHINIPGRTGDVIQYSEKHSQEVSIRGIVRSDADRTTLLGYLGTYQTYTDSDETFNVFVEEVDIPIVGGKPSHYSFVIALYKNMQV